MTELLPEQRFDSLSPKEAELPLTLVWEPGARFQSGGRGGGRGSFGFSRGPRVHVKYEQQQRETLLCCCCGAKAASLSVSLGVNPASHHLQLMTPCFTSPTNAHNQYLISARVIRHVSNSRGIQPLLCCCWCGD